ncbi:hypothetical protein [Limnobacter sp. MED105]|uniref:hypothetical protein n=1 Tax=Limnobacter sp. MED105 TaxID=391597 RepID=UPI000156C482|nr:hypothetical protein [Limnobacter sp. MED105]EDM82121.1 3-oxoacyl-(acyl carrier protein) synthase [Limnobacter sp. MED105]
MPHQLASARLLIRLDASGLGHANRLSDFASVPGGIAPRCEAAGKPCKAGQSVQHPSLAWSQILSMGDGMCRRSPTQVSARSGCDALAAPIKKTCPFEFTRHGRPKADTETRPALLPSEVSQGEFQKGRIRFSGARGDAPEQAGTQPNDAGRVMA